MSWRSALKTLYRNPFLQPKHTNPKRLIQRNTTMATSVKETQKYKDAFIETLPSILDSIEKHKTFAEVPSIGSWIRKLLEYNLAGGKFNRGLTTVLAYEMFEKPENVTEESLRRARVLGWCVEMLQSYFLILDDIMDSSTTRRGRPCWYRMPGVGLGALNDAQFIICMLNQVAKENFGTSPNYLKMAELFQEALLLTSVGQHLDVDMVYHSELNFDAFTMDKWNCITKYKTAFYTFKLPVALALYMADITSEESHKKVEKVCYNIGTLFQMQDDYIDCYGDESLTGKKGTDIQEGKCSWLAVKAYNKCTPKQKLVFRACYRSKEPAHIERIKFLYDQLKVKDDYDIEERRLYELILDSIKELPEELSPALFMKLIDMIYKRKL